MATITAIDRARTSESGSSASSSSPFERAGILIPGAHHKRRTSIGAVGLSTEEAAGSGSPLELLLKGRTDELVTAQVTFDEALRHAAAAAVAAGRRSHSSSVTTAASLPDGDEGPGVERTRADSNADSVRQLLREVGRPRVSSGFDSDGQATGRSRLNSYLPPLSTDDFGDGEERRPSFRISRQNSISSISSRASYNLASGMQTPRRPALTRRFSAQLTIHELNWNIYTQQLLDLPHEPGKSPILQLLVRNGVPHALRPKVWPILCGAKFRREENPEYYQSLLAENEGVETAFTRQIDTDLHRTCPERIEYSSELFGENPPAMTKLRRVLVAYGFHNIAVGYCQGMNFLAAFLLTVLEEEDAFWLLVTVIDRMLPANYYDKNLKGIKAEADLFEVIVAKELPELNRHLKNHGIDMAMFTLDWFVSLFTVGFRSRTTLRMWDLFLYEGRVSLFCVALAIVRINEQRLLQFKAMDKLYEALRGLAALDYNVDLIIKSVNIPAMSTMVKRLAFSIVQTPMLSDTISNARSAQTTPLSSYARPGYLSSADSRATSSPATPASSVGGGYHGARRFSEPEVQHQRRLRQQHLATGLGHNGQSSQQAAFLEKQRQAQSAALAAAPAGGASSNAAAGSSAGGFMGFLSKLGFTSAPSPTPVDARKRPESGPPLPPSSHYYASGTRSPRNTSPRTSMSGGRPRKEDYRASAGGKYFD